MSQTPVSINFGAYSEHVPANIPAAVQQATGRFLGNRQACVAEMPQWEALRQAASDIRLHTLMHLDAYLEKLAAQVTAAGGQVHWAADAAAARQTVLEIARQHNVRQAVKVKSMATEEIGLNHALQEAGIEVLETDLGEFIIQLAGTGPSHIIVPAVHLTKEKIAELFRQKLGVDVPADPIKLTEIARATLRQKFLAADMGISGTNFLVAETGTLITVTNEGNGRMCTTLPDLHVAVMGIDKVVPDWESLTVLLKLLARSATGQKLSTLYLVHHRAAPRRGRIWPQRTSPDFAGQRTQLRAARPAGPPGVEVHPLRLLFERLPGVQECGRLCLRLVHLRAGGQHLLAADFGRGSCRTVAVCLVFVRGVRRGLPGENSHPRYFAAPAPPRGGRRCLWRAKRPGDDSPGGVVGNAGLWGSLAIPPGDASAVRPHRHSAPRRMDPRPAAARQPLDEGAPLPRLCRPFPPVVGKTTLARRKTMTTNPILDNIRRSLGRTAGAPLADRLPIVAARTPGSQAAEIALLIEEIGKLSGTAQQMTRAEIPAALQALVAEQDVHRAALWRTAGLESLGIAAALQALGMEVVPPNADKHLLASCDLGVTEADFALPETGILGLLSTPEKPRAVSLLPRVHLALVSPAALRADLLQVFAEARQHDYLILITGPSRTADIELTVMLGVHGPKALYAWVVSG